MKNIIPELYFPSQNQKCAQQKHDWHFVNSQNQYNNLIDIYFCFNCGASKEIWNENDSNRKKQFIFLHK